MTKAIDVASYILNKIKPIPAMKLQKLVYYSQAWSLVWDDAPLFDEPVEAWANGPVVRALFDLHKGEFLIKSLPTKAPASQLTSTQQETIDAVLKEYGDKSSQWLSELTHLEAPWVNARQRAGLADGDRGSTIITHDDMYQYYSNL